MCLRRLRTASTSNCSSLSTNLRYIRSLPPILVRLDIASHCDHLLVLTRFPDTALLFYLHARLSASLYINKLLGIQHLHSISTPICRALPHMPCMPCLLAHVPRHVMQLNKRATPVNTTHPSADVCLASVTVTPASTASHPDITLSRSTPSLARNRSRYTDCRHSATATTGQGSRGNTDGTFVVVLHGLANKFNTEC